MSEQISLEDLLLDDNNDSPKKINQNKQKE